MAERCTCQKKVGMKRKWYQFAHRSSVQGTSCGRTMRCDLRLRLQHHKILPIQHSIYALSPSERWSLGAHVLKLTCARYWYGMGRKPNVDVVTPFKGTRISLKLSRTLMNPAARNESIAGEIEPLRISSVPGDQTNGQHRFTGHH